MKLTFFQSAFTCSKLTKRFVPCSNVSIINFEHVVAGQIIKDNYKLVSGQLQKISLNGAMLIAMNRVIITVIYI